MDGSLGEGFGPPFVRNSEIIARQSLAASRRCGLKRAYEPPAASDGLRILVERLWPRGLARERARIDHWCKEILPSPALRRWFGHEPPRWPEFQERYRAELAANAAGIARVRALCAGRRVTFVYAARDPAMNSALVLRDYLGAPLSKGPR